MAAKIEKGRYLGDPVFVMKKLIYKEKPCIVFVPMEVSDGLSDWDTLDSEENRAFISAIYSEWVESIYKSAEMAREMSGSVMTPTDIGNIVSMYGRG